MQLLRPTGIIIYNQKHTFLLSLIGMHTALTKSTYKEINCTIAAHKRCLSTPVHVQYYTVACYYQQSMLVTLVLSKQLLGMQLDTLFYCKRAPHILVVNVRSVCMYVYMNHGSWYVRHLKHSMIELSWLLSHLKRDKAGCGEVISTNQCERLIHRGLNTGQTIYLKREISSFLTSVKNCIDA